MNRPIVLTVSDLAACLQESFQASPLFADLWVRGEVSDLRRSPAGHWYFSLRDERALIRCVLFRSAALRVATLPEMGRSLLVHGSLDFYAAAGQCELRVDLILPEGVGLQQLQLEALRLRLEEEGLFAPERKRPLPPFPRRIGVVASESGAVIHDIVTVLERRYPLVEVVFAPSAVQGDRAPLELVAALRRLSRYRVDGRGVDLIILARGGGSSDDLAAFNDERVVRAVFASSAPVISAIGHETDYTLADLVADVRAPTPSVAAELATPDCAWLRSEVQRLGAATAAAVRQQIERWWLEVATCSRRLRLASPARRMASARVALEALYRRCVQATLAQVRDHRHHVELRGRQLMALDPAATLERGYALCYNQAGLVMTAASEVAPGDQVTVQLARGQVLGRVTEIKEPRHGRH